MSQVTPSQIFKEVSAAIPKACREHIVIIGSLAAGYHFFGDDNSKTVHTKDIDCVIEPFAIAVSSGQTIATQLLESGWQRHLKGEHQTPGTADTPNDQLPAIRLYPPNLEPNSEEAWFIEFLTVPQNEKSSEKDWTRLSLPDGDFGLPTFRFLSLTAFEPLSTGDLGIRYARPELMALSNMLAHPTIGSETMSSPIEGRFIKRANKDLGRVLAITTLADLDDCGPWALTWLKALQAAFPQDWRTHAQNVGSGIRELLDDPNNMDEAHHSCAYGLLSSQPPTIGALRAAGERLLVDAIEELEELAKNN